MKNKGRKPSTTPGPFSRSRLARRMIFSLMSAGLVGLLSVIIFVILRQAPVKEFGLPEATSYESLLDHAQQEGKLSLLKFEAPYCYPCAFGEHVSEAALLGDLAEQVSMYTINALDLSGEGRGLADHYNIRQVPAWLVLDPSGNELARWEGDVLPSYSALEQLSSGADPLPKMIKEGAVEKNRFGLLMGETPNFWAVLALAEELEPVLLESVWMQPMEDGRWGVVAGNYRTAAQAVAFRDYRFFGQEKRMDVVPLKMVAFRLPWDASEPK